MKLRRKFAGVVVAGIVVLAYPTGAGAIVDGTGGTSAVTATITTAAIGSRAVTVTAPIAMTSALSSETLSGTLLATVAEAARSGTNPWSLTASMTDLTNATNDVIGNANMAVSGRAVTQTAGGGTSAAPTGSTAMGSTATLMSNTGQLTTVVYTGTYATESTWTLTPPNGAKVGVYTGTVTLTLSQ